MAELILKRTDVKINQVSDKGTALHVAAKHGKLELVSLLLDNGADLTYLLFSSVFIEL